MAMLWLIGGQDLIIPNVAIEGQATQSSSYHHSIHTIYKYERVFDDPDDAHYAIDGILSTAMFQSGDRCAITNADPGAWWQVDLKHQFKIRKVALRTRKRC